MIKTIDFKNTKFRTEHFQEIISKLGKDAVCGDLEIANDIESYSTKDLNQFFNIYKKGFTSFSFSCRNEATRFRASFYPYSSSTSIAFEADDEHWIDEQLSSFREWEASCVIVKESLKGKLFNIERYCLVKQIHWQSLPHLGTELSKHGMVAESVSTQLSWYPDSIKYDSWEPALREIDQRGEPPKFSIWVRGSISDEKFSLNISKGRFSDSNEKYLSLALDGCQSMDVLNAIMSFLQLNPALAITAENKPERTAFIAHRFDAKGQQAADRLARFLELAGFSVRTGKSYSPKSVAAKVSERLESQAIVFVILTSGDDSTWLIQESMIASMREKHLFIMREADADFKPAHFGDMEYIPFEGGRIEGGFISVMEGLRELGHFA